MNTQNIYNNKDINTKINLDTNSNTKIKICGLTSPAEARYLNENHVDFAGMVLFFPKSKRNISIEQAKEIMAALDASIRSDRLRLQALTMSRYMGKFRRQRRRQQ